MPPATRRWRGRSTAANTPRRKPMRRAARPAPAARRWVPPPCWSCWRIFCRWTVQSWSWWSQRWFWSSETVDLVKFCQRAHRFAGDGGGGAQTALQLLQNLLRALPGAAHCGETGRQLVQRGAQCRAALHTSGQLVKGNGLRQCVPPSLFAFTPAAFAARRGRRPPRGSGGGAGPPRRGGCGKIPAPTPPAFCPGAACPGCPPRWTACLPRWPQSS